MDIRLEVLRINGIWELASGESGLTPFRSEPEAVEAAIEAARKHHDKTGGTAVVHLWHGAHETAVFDTSADRCASDP